MKLLKNIIKTLAICVLTIVIPFIIFTIITLETNILFGINSFVLVSENMDPKFPVDSVVYVKKQNSYKLGEVVAYKNSANQRITRRIYSIVDTPIGTNYFTKGDAHNTADKTSLNHTRIIGRVFFFVPYLGKVVEILKEPVFFLILVILPSILLITAKLIAIKREMTKLNERNILEAMKANVDTGGTI